MKIRIIKLLLHLCVSGMSQDSGDIHNVSKTVIVYMCTYIKQVREFMIEVPTKLA